MIRPGGSGGPIAAMSRIWWARGPPSDNTKEQIVNDSSTRPVVDTTTGPVMGVVIDENINAFKGIPFAQPPIGRLRFRPPRPAVGWREPLDAGEFGPAPMQARIDLVVIPGDMAEDCLTINVWAPVAPGPHPVVFSIFGGGNMVGASSQPDYDGASFSSQGLVYVSANYRIGALGCMELGGVDSSYSGSSLNGLHDLTAALVWVRHNIEAFGGDPSRVTLLGQSAGAKNQCALAAMPSARGLFHRMTVMSGGGHTVFRSIEEAAPVAKAFLTAAQCTTIDELATLPVQAVVRAQEEVAANFPRGFPYRPTVDGTTLPHAPIDAAIQGLTVDLDIVVGTTADEAATFVPPGDGLSEFNGKMLANVDVATMSALTTAYDRALADLPTSARRLRQLTAEEYWMPSIRFAEAHARAGGSAWMYRFDRPLTRGPLAGLAPHGSDIPFTFGAHNDYMPFTALSNFGDDAVAAAAASNQVWARWARTGELSLPNGAEWPRYDDDRRRTLVRTEHPEVVDDPRGEERRLWNGLL